MYSHFALRDWKTFPWVPSAVPQVSSVDLGPAENAQLRLHGDPGQLDGETMTKSRAFVFYKFHSLAKQCHQLGIKFSRHEPEGNIPESNHNISLK